MFKVRNYKQEDYDFVKAILEEANLYDEVWDSKENLLGMIDKDPNAILVSEGNQKILGCVFIIPFGPKVSFIYRLVVKKEYRNKGIASEIIRQAEKILINEQVSEIGLQVDINNAELNDFYKKRSFQSSKQSYVYMWKALRKVLNDK